ncbi:MAG: 2-phospho-L-lactate guanylyltransferase [Rubrivivax sp.]|nr:2-phospho-L-lactate guanylyltransferase [Rubrivivax sp.]
MRPCAVVPVKRFTQAKQRLHARCDDALRHALARAMLEDVLDALAAARGLAGVLLVTADAEAAGLARRRGMDVLEEAQPGGLNAAVTAAARHLRALGRRAMLVVPADAPGVSVAEIEHLGSVHAQRGDAVTLVPSHDHGGTNALLLDPPDAMAPAFGPDSFHRHLRRAHAAGLATSVLELPGLGLDLDHPHDLQRFVATPSDTRTRRLLQAHTFLPGSAGMPRPPTRPALPRVHHLLPARTAP